MGIKVIQVNVVGLQKNLCSCGGCRDWLSVGTRFDTLPDAYAALKDLGLERQCGPFSSPRQGLIDYREVWFNPSIGDSVTVDLNYVAMRVEALPYGMTA